ncbi:MAG: tetratricopeptide repeat protein [Pseudomonadota bacterium]
MLTRVARWACRRYAARLTRQGELHSAVRVWSLAMACGDDSAQTRRQLGELHLHLAAALESTGGLLEAVKWLQDAVRLDARNANAWLRLGRIRLRMGEFDESVRCLRQSLAIDPRQAEACFHLGSALSDLKRHDAAIAVYREALALKPDFAEAHCNLGALFNDVHRHDAAIASCRAALALRPEFPEAHNNLAVALHQLRRDEEAIASCEQALAIAPNFAEAHNNLGAALIAMNRHEQAIASLRRALAIMPDHAWAHYNLGAALYALGDHSGALDSYASAVAHQPDSAEARWVLAMCQTPRMFDAEGGSGSARAAYSGSLTELNAWLVGHRMQGAEIAVGAATPFHLAYQEQPNRELLSRYGDLCARLMRHWWDKEGLSRRVRGDSGTVRVGIVSAHVKDHSVWNAIVKGWIRHLDRGRFDLSVFHLAAEQDHETEFAMSQSDYVALAGKGLRECAANILDRQPDILIYPEIGMDPMTTRLASLRIAPVQAASWGHPETSGLPTIDYYLSAEDMEPPQAQENYRERLVLLPHLGCCYHPFTVAPGTQDLARLGVDTARPLLLCAGAPFKYVPEHDGVLVAIARELGRCQFIFFIDDAAAGLSARLQRRLAGSFARAGLEFNDYVVFIAVQQRPLFYDLMRRASVFLDTIGFSGFNTAMQAVECALPVVTREGRFLRGRLASGILRRLQLTELIAATEQEYVALAVKLVQDDAYRRELRVRIEASRHVLFDDLAPIRALEAFLIDAYRRHRDRAEAASHSA